MRPLPSRRALAVVAGVALFAAACGGTSSDEAASAPADDESRTPTSAPATTTDPTTAAAPATEPPASPSEAGSAEQAPAPPPPVEVPEQLGFTAATLDGGTFEGADLAGTDAVAWFWAPWCTTCRAEAPDVAEVAAIYADQVEFLGVGGRGDIAEMQGFVSDTGTGGFPHVVDESGDIWTSFEVSYQPAFAFIDDDGTVTVHVGTLGADALTERVDELVAS